MQQMGLQVERKMINLNKLDVKIIILMFLLGVSPVL